MGASDDIVFLRDAGRPNGEYVPRDGACISADDRGFVFGDGVYEVVRAYYGKLFMLEAHMARFQRSLREIRLNGGDLSDFEAIMRELLERRGLLHCDATVYAQITRGAAPRAHAFPMPPVPVTLYMSAAPAADYSEAQNRGVELITVSDFRWARCDIKTISLQANVLCHQYARDRGAQECLFLREGVATEGSHTNFFGVLDGVVRTHPATNHILAGVTRAAVLSICRRLSIAYAEDALYEDDLRRLDEAFITGTTYEVAPVVRINGVPVGDGKPGPVCRRIQSGWNEIAHGS